MRLRIAPCVRSRRAVSNGGLLLSVAFDLTCLVALFGFHGYMHECMHGCKDAYMDACMHACMHACVHACVHV